MERKLLFKCKSTMIELSEPWYEYLK